MKPLHFSSPPPKRPTSPRRAADRQREVAATRPLAFPGVGIHDATLQANEFAASLGPTSGGVS